MRGVLKVFTPANMEGDFHYKIEVAPYNVTGTDYEADLTKQTNRSQKNWITIDEPKGVLGPNETREIHYTVTVPEDAPGGGQYAVILVGSDEDETAASDGMLIQNVYEMASVLYAQVSGDIKRDGRIELNEVPGFITTTPMWVKVQLENNGNIHESAKIDILVKNFLNGAQVYPGDGDFVEGCGGAQITAGTDNGSGSAQNVGYTEDGFAKMEGLPYAFGRFGYVDATRFYNLAGHGNYWSGSTVSSASSFYLGYNGSGLYPAHQDSRGYGWSVRCVAR